MVLTGLDRVVRGLAPRPKGRVALVTHGSALTAQGVPAHVALVDAGVDVRLILSPEHGPYGVAQDMEGVEGTTDPMTGLPVVSLYGDSEDSLAPAESLLEDVDVVVWDLVDIGTRYYTYVWTGLLVLRVAHSLGRETWILDRPNPLGGRLLHGNIGHIPSFVGLQPVLVRHGMTAGELLSLVAREEGLDDGLRIVRMEGWSRDALFDQTGLVWVPPSPNMPTLEAALLYPGMCLVEATTLSEGRGTTTPFLVAGAPYIDPVRLVRELGTVDGLTIVPTYFRPMFQKHAGEVCGGIRLAVTDRNALDPWTFGLNLLSAVARLWPEEFSWRPGAYEFVTDVPAIDLLTGDPFLRERIEGGERFEPGEFTQDIQAWQEIREPYLLY